MDCCHIDIINQEPTPLPAIGKIMDDWAADIWAGKNPPAINGGMVNFYTNYFKEAIISGWKSADVIPVDWHTKDPLRFAVMEANVSRFAHAKTAKAAEWINEMARKSSTFGIFKQNMDIVNQVYNGNWLKAEYNLAWATGQNGAKYMRHIKEKETFPYVEYQTIGDARVRHAHKILDGKHFIVGSDAYDYIMPPNGWGCRCELIQIQEHEVDMSKLSNEHRTIDLLKKGGDYETMKKGGFLTNRAKTGRVFGERDIPMNKPPITIKPIKKVPPVAKPIVPPSLPGKPKRLPGESDIDYLVRINRKTKRAAKRAAKPPEPVKPLPPNPLTKRFDDIRKAQEKNKKLEIDYARRKAERLAKQSADKKAAIDKQLKELQKVKEMEEKGIHRFGFGEQKAPETYGAPSGRFGVENYDPVKGKRHPHKINPEFWEFVEKETYTGSFKPKSGAYFSHRSAIPNRGGTSRYLRDENGDIISGRMVNIPKGQRWKASKHYQSNVMYHEFGHSIHHSTKTVTTGFDSVTIHPKIESWVDKWRKKISPQLEKTTLSPTGRRRWQTKSEDLPPLSKELDNFNGWDDNRTFYKFKEDNPKLYKKLTEIGEDDQGIWEMWAAMSDTLEALTRGKAGRGHGRNYYLGNGKPEAEIFAHMTEITWLENPVWKHLWPEMHDDLQKLGMEFYKRKKKPPKLFK